MAIKQREPVSMLRYSTNLRFGRGVEKDENAATRLFNDAAKATVEAVRSPQGLCR